MFITFNLVGRFVILLLLFGCFNFTCHAQILEGLKDAVLNAEGVFGDIFRSLGDVAKQVKFTKEAWEDTIEEDCKFECPNGKSPKKNKYYRPSSNGCGVPGLGIDSQYLPSNEMTKCCDQHDICYGTCNKDKDECDLVFKKCLYRICDNFKQGQSQTILTGCKTAAKMLYSGTTMFGCKFFKNAQQEACYCPSQKFTGDEF